MVGDISDSELRGTWVKADLLPGAPLARAGVLERGRDFDRGARWGVTTFSVSTSFPQALEIREETIPGAGARRTGVLS
jgi:DNA helicase-2/ATP-dependent DNA helicase PcrA